MSKRPPKGKQDDAINRYSPQVQISFDIPRLEAFVTSLGVDFMHFRAMPSPIGKSDRGDLRRNNGVDQITSNGMIYTFVGKFTATMTDNARHEKQRSGSGLLDPSEARLVMPRFYNKKAVADGERIYLQPGDRLYLSDPDADTFVATSHLMDYEPNIDNEPVFPIAKMPDGILDSQNREYTQGVDFIVTAEGNIRWLPTGKNPGIDPDTGKGRTYAVNYLYKAFYYVISLPKEVRVTNVTTGGVRAPERMAMHAIIVREYIFHQRNRGDKTNPVKPKSDARTVQEPVESINPNKFVIPVDMTNFINNDSDDDK